MKSMGLFDDFSTVQKVNAYLEQFFASENSITEAEWYESLPTDNERMEMIKLLKSLYKSSDNDDFCHPSVMDDYSNLTKSCTITLFKDTYCIVHERNTSRRYWGYVVIARNNGTKRNLHHSASHFQSDGDVCNESAAIFERTNSKTLVINGANRYAVKSGAKNQCQNKTFLADAAHNTETMYQTFNQAIYQLKKHFNTISFGAEIPHAESHCNLSGTTNVFGRYVNGVPEANVCYQSANKTQEPAMFVHIEQKRRVRDDWNLWTQIITEIF
uniref:Uncharacterized protein n=1 Tax=Setaria digitata TaxID=48799 RepID=A0A915PHA9_9BILA